MNMDAVFEGGGMKAIGLVGAACCLQDKGYNIKNFAGSSAGAIVAALLAAGYSGRELKDIIMNLNYNEFLDNNKLKKIRPLMFAKNFITLFKDKGVYSGDPIEKYIGELLEAKGKTKFKDLSVEGKSYLKVIISDITKGDMLIAPDDLIKYDIDPMEFEIAKVVRMSISMPFIFKPVKLSYKNEVSFIVDGGILSNYPIWVFDVNNKPRWPTFGMKLIEDKKTFTAGGKTDIISFTFDVISAMINKNEEIYIKNKDWVRTIPIPTLNVGTTQINITKDLANKLFESGYESAEKFLSKWNFNRYVADYRSKNII
ncbi:MAG: patatin-like phospholipase family protein [Clostridium sp.]|nr:patatin-like phospholipase family protein [Clostridium sp.]